ncbi:hypothetical protein CSUI_008498, partial [Cystoisospora suis]
RIFGDRQGTDTEAVYVHLNFTRDVLEKAGGFLRSFSCLSCKCSFFGAHQRYQKEEERIARFTHLYDTTSVISMMRV